MRRKSKFIMILFVCMVAMLAGCGQSKKEPDDYATNNVKSEKTDSAKKTSEGIAKDKIKVGVVHLSDPAEGSGYTYTHELGIQGMQKNLGLSDEQIVRKNNVDDTDALATQKAIQECIDEGCNIIFGTSWGYMDVMEQKIGRAHV